MIFIIIASLLERVKLDYMEYAFIDISNKLASIKEARIKFAFALLKKLIEAWAMAHE